MSKNILIIHSAPGWLLNYAVEEIKEEHSQINCDLLSCAAEEKILPRLEFTPGKFHQLEATSFGLNNFLGEVYEQITNNDYSHVLLPFNNETGLGYESLSLIAGLCAPTVFTVNVLLQFKERTRWNFLYSYWKFRGRFQLGYLYDWLACKLFYRKNKH